MEHLITPVSDIFHAFTKNILLNWKQYLSTDPETISDILSQKSIVQQAYNYR